MKRSIIYLLILPLFCCSACQGFLDVYPENGLLEDESWESMDDFARHWRGAYATLNNAGGFTEATRVYGDIQCDLAYSVVGYSNVLKDMYRWNFNSASIEVAAIWNAMWKTIGEVNSVFDHLPEMREMVNGQDSLEMEVMLGDMYFLRALCYSKLTEYYCEGYDPSGAAEQLGMPICETTEVGKPGRASLKATYDFMYEDLRKAVGLLEPLTYKMVMTRMNFLASRQAAEALWARIALNRKDYQTAAAKAESALTSCLNEGMRLDVDTLYYGNLFRGTDAGEELLFFVGMRPEDVTGSIGMLFCTKPYGYFHPEYVPASWLLNLYEEDDVRLQAFFEEGPSDYNHGLKWNMLVKDGHNPELDISSVNYNYQSMPKMFRLSELYLIIAEANAVMEGGDLERGNKVLNDLRKARIFNYEEKKYTPNGLLGQVKLERARELCFEGFRLPDLKRWEDGFRRTPQPYTNSPDNEMSIAGDNVRFTWPIPKSELEINENMQPNKSN